MLKNILASTALLFALGFAASAQITFAIYVNVTTDGNNVYGSGSFQYSANNCSMCSEAQHTYAQTVTISGPSGQSTCTFAVQATASVSQNLGCEATIPFADDGDEASWTGTASENVDCSMAGPNFINTSAAGIATIHHSGYIFTGYDSTGYYCNWGNYGANCPGPTSQPHQTLGCGPQALKECADATLSNGTISYRIVCAGVGPPGGLPLSVLECN
jgi:hypothetical protein